MGEPLLAALTVVMLIGGMAMIGYAAYLQYASLPEEHTYRQSSRRVALGLGGLALILLGTWLLS